jgi:hypothetical protein|tara:strand:- start:505 stop:708 length:204 start_codon:yes stop_codon:yes gene_type:complete
MRNEIIEVQGKLFQVKRKFPEQRINLDVKDGIQIIKEYYRADSLFKAQGLLWVCNEIKEISYEEIKE